MQDVGSGSRGHIPDRHRGFHKHAACQVRQVRHRALQWCTEDVERSRGQAYRHMQDESYEPPK